jgi:hypothetical protein
MNPNSEPAQHVPNMHPSTILTPAGWKHTSIHPDAGGRFKVCGYASATPWLPGDLKALGVKVKSGKVWGLTKERALEIGTMIETAMTKAEAGHPLPIRGLGDPAPEIASGPAKPSKPAPQKSAVADQPSLL